MQAGCSHAGCLSSEFEEDRPLQAPQSAVAPGLEAFVCLIAGRAIRTAQQQNRDTRTDEVCLGHAGRARHRLRCHAFLLPSALGSHAREYCVTNARQVGD